MDGEGGNGQGGNDRDTTEGMERWRFQRLPTADGGRLRLGFWPAPAAPRGSVLLLPGRCETLEKYAEQAADWTRRGFAAVGLDWRGQGGSSRFLANAHKGHVTDFDLYLDDLAAALPVLLPADAPGPAVAFGHSMGGHILLRFLAERQHPFAAAVACAPMLGIRTAPLPEPLARMVAAAMVRRGLGEHYALGQTDWLPADPPFAGNPLTSDPARFLVGHVAYRDDPELALGGVTWGWLDAAFRSMRRLWRDARVVALTVPVLVLSAGGDRIVLSARQQAFATRLPQGRVRVYPRAQHELMMEVDSIRDRVWADIDAFLVEALPTPAGAPAPAAA